MSATARFGNNAIKTVKSKIKKLKRFISKIKKTKNFWLVKNFKKI